MPGTSAIFILDSSFFLSGFQLPDGELYTVPQVVDEVKPERKELLFSQAVGLSVVTPSDASIDHIREVGKQTGDLSRLSNPDIHLLALTYELKGILLTDDYSMQNTAAVLGIEYRPIAQKGITRVQTWYFRCRYCGAYQSKEYPDCPICGGPMKTTRRPPNGGASGGKKGRGRWSGKGKKTGRGEKGGNNEGVQEFGMEE